jgi:hypothetical protein
VSSSDGSYTIQPSPVITYLTIERLSQASLISATETVAARYTTSNSQAFNTGHTIIGFETKSFDTHNAQSGSGTSWRYTAPVSGIYYVSAMMNMGTIALTQAELLLYVNGSMYSFLADLRQVTSNTFTKPNGSDLVRLKAGDYIQIAMKANTSGSTFANEPESCKVNIQRIGL